VSTPLSGPVEANVPPRQRLASLAYRRDALYQSAAENDAAAQARLQELREQRRLGQLDPAYDIDADHRAAMLREGAAAWRVEAEQVSQQHDDLERTLRGGPGGPGSGVAKAQVPSRQRTTGGSA
jgi:hypothetical protein